VTKIWRSNRPGGSSAGLLLQQIGRSDHDDLVALGEAVELHQELVERLVLSPEMSSPRGA
jgi:hypothetical protein